MDYSRGAPSRGGTTATQSPESEGSPPPVAVVAFDPGLSTGRVRVVPVDSVVDLLMHSHVPEKIEAYRCAMVAGDRFPPVCVVRVGRRYLIADGHKRFGAYRPLSSGTIPIEIWSAGRWLRDQAGQFRRNLRKNRMIVRAAATDRSEARRLILATLGHWKRVARCLIDRLLRSTPA